MALATGVEVRDEFASFLEQNLNKELLRFTTAGSVDDGKSTLIGRLLHDSKTVYEDQLASVKQSRINRSGGPIDFSLLTDGLRAEREQGITIDVGYRYFATSRRKFIIADAPGHEQYTRNMATGASTADLAVILIDGEKGVLPQTLRHSYIASMLGIPIVLAAINKMDRIGYREETFLKLEQDFLTLAHRLGFREARCIPVSALAGDNIVERSDQMPWWVGPTLLEYLETVSIAGRAPAQAVRFPVQYVLRPDASFRGFAGQIAGGTIRPGDALTALPSGRQTRVQSIVTYDGPLDEAFAPMSVALKLEDEIDLSRGDMLVSPHTPPHVSKRFQAMVVWMNAQPLEPGRNYLIKQTTREVRGRITRIRHRMNINTLEPEAVQRLEINDIAAVELETSTPLFFDFYRQNRTTGSFIVIDPLTNSTLGAGMIREDLPEDVDMPPAAEQQRPRALVTPLERHRRHGHYPAIILTGAHAALAKPLERALFEAGFEVIVIDKNASSISSRTAWATLHAAGFVVIYQSPSLGIEERAELLAAAGNHFLDLAELDLPSADTEAVRRVLALAESFRIPPAAENPRKVI
ncbi:MAG: sulfate adenylyltransferase subunit CysN [Candidatus Acidiferrum sp.]